MIPSSVGMIILYQFTDIFGPDNASQYTGHFYVNTLVGYPDTIKFIIYM